MKRREGKLLERTDYGTERRLHLEADGGCTVAEWAKRQDDRFPVPIKDVKLSPAGASKLLDRLAAARAAAVDGVAGALLQKVATTDALRAALPAATPGKLVPTSEQMRALHDFAVRYGHGRRWRWALNCCWQTGRYADAGVPEADVPLLQGLRNGFGPSWLARVRLGDLASRRP